MLVDANPDELRKRRPFLGQAGCAPSHFVLLRHDSTIRESEEYLALPDDYKHALLKNAEVRFDTG